MGQTAEKMSLGLNKDFELAESLEEAVAKAQQQAEGGDTVVMSPGAASFDMFENFEERASRYQKIVKEMM
jgi:UDP-N-acetylmuramoylalanine--D-glutamate ligase